MVPVFPNTAVVTLDEHDWNQHEHSDNFFGFNPGQNFDP